MMSVKHLHKFGSFYTFPYIPGMGKVDLEEKEPISMAEAEGMMSKMKQDNLMRVVQDKIGKM